VLPHRLSSGVTITLFDGTKNPMMAFHGAFTPLGDDPINSKEPSEIETAKNDRRIEGRPATIAGINDRSTGGGLDYLVVLAI
jgi:hypothetical protein